MYSRLTVFNSAGQQSVSSHAVFAVCLLCFAGLCQSLTWLTFSHVTKLSPACASLMSAMRPGIHCCCVAAVSPIQEYKSVCYSYLNTQDHLISEQFLLRGSSGYALSVKLSEKTTTLIQEMVNSTTGHCCCSCRLWTKTSQWDGDNMPFYDIGF